MTHPMSAAMLRNRKLSRLERAVAVGLSSLWLAAGTVSLWLALASARWAWTVAALAALIYGLAWLRVARLGRPLSWPEVVVPRRAARD
jgi:hypothetical protein